MRKRINIIAVAIVLAVLSFVFARYLYIDRNSATIGNEKITNPLADKSLFGNWVRDELVFAVIIPAALVAGGVALAVRK